MMYDEFYGRAQRLVQDGIPFATATVVRAEKPTSGKPGDKAIITVDGVMHGWIGGSCAQPVVVKQALLALAKGEARLIRLSAQPEAQAPREGLLDLPMTCFSGGTLEIYVEPQLPRPRLLIVGNLPLAQALAHLGKAMNYHVVAVDLEQEGAGMEHADEVLTSLEEIGAQIGPQTYVVVATHGTYDEAALEKILAAQPTYVGLVASKRRAQAVRDYLLLQGFGDEELLSLKSPAGLDIRARRGDEIALSIMTEVVQRRRSAEALDLALLRQTEGETEAGAAGASTTQVAEAIDPICKMTVTIDTATYVSEFEGQRYYFCCAGCKQTFDADPAAYAGEGVPITGSESA
jgi:xanthine dehydrogenase accessory factor